MASLEGDIVPACLEYGQVQHVCEEGAGCSNTERADPTRGKLVLISTVAESRAWREGKESLG